MFLYRPGTSLMHRMDAVTKLIWLVAVTGMLLITSSLIENFIIFLWLLLVSIGLAGLPAGQFLWRLLPLTSMGVWLLVVMAVFYQQGVTPVAALGPLTLTREGMVFGLALFLRVLSLGATSMIFALTTEPRKMVNELIEFGRLPYRFAYAFYAALRFLPLLQSEARIVLNAHAVRGAAGAKGRGFDRLVPIRRLTIPLLVNAIRRVHIAAIAMDSRAFGAYPKRTNIDDLERPTSGVVFVAFHVGAFVALFVWRVILGRGSVLRPIILQ